MLTTDTELHFRLAMALQTPTQESKWLPDFVSRITPNGWVLIAVIAIVLLVVLFYYFTIDELELGIPPKVKFKRRVSAQEPVATQTDSRNLQATSLIVSDQSTTPSVAPKVIQPNLVHPYALQANFTGRIQEREELTTWLSNNEHPIYELVAMGGMGKSALTWYWLTRDVIPASTTRLDSVMWWSFYEGESSFARFVDEAFKYVCGEPIDAERFPTTYDRAQELRQLLQTKLVLFVLDGFERQLRDYASLDAAYKSEESSGLSREARSCVDPITSRLLRDVAAATTNAKLLITTRLPVSDLEDRAGQALEGVFQRELKQLSPEDAITFMRAQGVTKGTPGEITNICEAYGYHPLSLRLLSGVIRRDAKMPGDINAAPRHDVHDDIIQRRHHVLEQSYDALRKRERALVSRIAAFRGPVTFEELEIFRNAGEGARFEEALEDLRVRGLLQREGNRFDLHPIVRRYAYDRLNNKTLIHKSLADYFGTVIIPTEDKVQSVEDLAPVIELYHHTLRASSYDEAGELFYNRLVQPIYLRLGAYHTTIELLSALFSDGEDFPPRLRQEDGQAWAIDVMANCYTRIGQPNRAVKLFELAHKLSKKVGNWSDIATGLGNLSDNLISLGQLQKAELSLRCALALFKPVEDLGNEARFRQRLGGLLALEGCYAESVVELDIGMQYNQAMEASHFNISKDWQGKVWANHARRALLMGEAQAAYLAAQQARGLAKVMSLERDLISAEWLLGAALVMQGTNLTAAAVHLGEALTRCRRIDMVDLEPDILLTLAQWHRAKGNPSEAQLCADEALGIADRCEYRLKQADIHNFLARLAVGAGKRDKGHEHAEIGKERAWCDGPPHCYKSALDEAEVILTKLAKKI